MAQQTINIGASPNDGTGTPLRTAFQYTNSNFSELYTALGGGSGLPGSSGQVIFNDGGTNLAGDTGLTFNKTTDTLGTGRLTTSGDAIVCSSTGDFYVGTTLSPQFKVERATGSATISGDLTVDTSTLKVDSANDRVGIGTPTPASQFHIFNSGATTDTFLQIENGTASTYIGTRGTTFGAMDVGDSYIFNSSGNDIVLMASNASGAIKFAAGGSTESMRLNSTGNLAFPTGKGIDFSAVTGGTGTATGNVLNDYEEGTFTPTVGDASSGGNQATTATAVGRYTKIGRLVTVQWEVTDINTTGLTAGNALYIRGLPFASSSATTQFGTPAVSGVTFSGYLTAGVFSGSSFPIYSSSSGGSLADIKVSAVASGTADIWGTLTYIV